MSEESAIPMIADEDAVDHIPKNLPQCDRSHGCAQGAAARNCTCTEWCSFYSTGSQFFEGVCWEGGRDLFQEGLQFVRKK